MNANVVKTVMAVGTAPRNHLPSHNKSCMKWDNKKEARRIALLQELADCRARLIIAQKNKDDYDQALLDNPPNKKPKMEATTPQEEDSSGEEDPEPAIFVASLSSSSSSPSSSFASSSASTNNTEITQVDTSEAPLSKKRSRAPHQKKKQHLRQRLHKKQKIVEAKEQELEELNRQKETYKAYQLKAKDRHEHNQDAWQAFFDFFISGEIGVNQTRRKYWDQYYKEHGALHPFCPYVQSDGNTPWTFRGSEKRAVLGPCQCREAEAIKEDARQEFLEKEDYKHHMALLEMTRQLVRSTMGADSVTVDSEGLTHYSYERTLDIKEEPELACFL